MADSGELYTGMEVDDDLSSAMGNRDPRRSRPNTLGLR